jgi:hypothetical protein
LGVRASEKAKMASEGLAVPGSIVDRSSERRKRGYDEMGGWLSLAPQRLMEWGGARIEKIEERMEGIGMWAREGSVFREITQK